MARPEHQKPLPPIFSFNRFKHKPNGHQRGILGKIGYIVATPFRAFFKIDRTLNRIPVIGLLWKVAKVVGMAYFGGSIFKGAASLLGKVKFLQPASNWLNANIVPGMMNIQNGTRQLVNPLVSSIKGALPSGGTSAGTGSGVTGVAKSVGKAVETGVIQTTNVVKGIGSAGSTIVTTVKNNPIGTGVVVGGTMLAKSALKSKKHKHKR